jgi:hypothetical protein
MENFTNETIDTTLLPKFEEVQFSVLDADYWKVTVLNVFVFFFNCSPTWSIVVTYLFLVGISAAYFLFFFVLLLSRISFNKKGFAFDSRCSF